MIANCITQFFMNLYFDQQDDWPFLDVLEFPTIFGEKANWLERPFDKTKTFEVIKDFNGDKLPKPIGFPMAFFQSCLEILKNATFITLIPKKKTKKQKTKKQKQKLQQ